MSWPWGSYLGDEGLTNGIRAKISSWQRIPPNVVPHVSKATGVYLNSMLAVTEANNAGYDEAILLTPEGTVADGSGENIFVVRDGVIYTPDLATGILPGITRDTVTQIAQDLGYTVVEKPLIRSDLYLADEVFMCGTAAEVTPLRSIDDHEIGVGPVTWRSSARTSTRCAARASAGRSGSTTCRSSRGGEHHHAHQPQRSLDRRARRGARARGAALGSLSLGPTGPRFESLFAERVGAPHCAAVSSGTAGLHLCMRLAGIGPGDEVITSPYRSSPRRTARFTRARSRSSPTSTRARSTSTRTRSPPRSRRGRVPSSRWTSSATPPSTTRSCRFARITASR